jgi:hypothetical protein
MFYFSHCRLCAVEYRPLLPPEQKPPLELNRGLMERYRPKMREHYLKRAAGVLIGIVQGFKVRAEG